MSYRTTVVMLLSLVTVLFFSCKESNPLDPGGIVAGPTVTDADGNVYTSIVIGTQTWTVENWRSTKYNDGTAIPHITDSAAWGILSTPGYCYYSNATHTDTIKKWGALYNWYVVAPTNPKQIAPAGWHVPTDEDWTTLENYLVLNGYNWDGTTDTSYYYNKIAQSMASPSDWSSYTEPGTIGNNLSKNNSSGFSALPGGGRGIDGNFYGQSDNGDWWGATQSSASGAYGRYLRYNDEGLGRDGTNKQYGFSVRLVQD